MIVAPIITQLSDLFGRRLTFLIPLYIAVISNLICAVAPNYVIFLIFRFFAGVATTGFSVIGFVLCMESVALEFRSLIPFMGTITWVIGYVSAGLLRLVITNWRWLYFAVSVPGLLTIPYIRTSSRFNGVEIPLQECKSSNNIGSERLKRTVFDMLKSPALVLHLVLNSYILVVMNGTYWALSLFSTELSDDKMTGFFLSGLVELPAGLVSIVLLIYLDRKTVSFLSLVLQAFSMVCALYLPKQTAMIFPLMAKVFNSIAWSSQPLLYTESTPTSVRNVFCGVVGFFGDFGSVLAPYFKRLETIHKSAPALVIAAMSVTSALIVLVLPETKDKKLPEDIDDLDPGPLVRWMTKNKKKMKKNDSQNDNVSKLTP
uniref:MFS domain-containing protein n=1 Tax=Angiostrongylus cantonensis TaxID=6313 RepID=A0A0K0CVL9_ANGCA